MALFLQYKTNGIQWAVWKMEESLDALLLLLPGARRAFCEQELNRFVSERRKMEWLSVRVLLYSMLQEDKEIGYSPEGKPYLTDHSFFISISHTKGYVAVMLASSVPVGIDIEQYAQRVHKVCDRYVRPDEQVESYQGDITWGLLLHWSAKVAATFAATALAGQAQEKTFSIIPEPVEITVTGQGEYLIQRNTVIRMS